VTTSPSLPRLMWASTASDGRRFRNTEIFGFDGDKISRVEVYFGWDVE
jgi:hypothetical protein